ncbi:hypothetical protein RJT34_14309 [Clitoria ternatea]|uniref:DUF7722 domain-containing protein n=1 Tax=Clitoria ternatea TaxID=43366 RepID=A0AAN9JSS4_CLITE
MALRWLLHCACNVLGYPMNNREEVKKWKQIEEYNPNGGFQMPLHYPRYTKHDYESMEEWKVDLLLKQYGLSYKGTLHEKRAFAMGAFLWPHQY